MAKRKACPPSGGGLLTEEELNRRFPKSLKEAIDLSIEKYKRLLANWDTATAKELARKHLGPDTCALCQFCGLCIKCPLWLEDGRGACVTSSRHPYANLWLNLDSGRKARARKYAEEILRILKEKAKEMKRKEKSDG